MEMFYEQGSMNYNKMLKNQNLTNFSILYDQIYVPQSIPPISRSSASYSEKYYGRTWKNDHSLPRKILQYFVLPKAA